jgi:hypothetical protein
MFCTTAKSIDLSYEGVGVGGFICINTAFFGKGVFFMIVRKETTRREPLNV